MSVVVCITILIFVLMLFVVLKRKLPSKLAFLNAVFKFGYHVYCNTRLGHWYFKREISRAHVKHDGGRHSVTEPWISNGVIIQPIPFSNDNYCYLVTDEWEFVSVLIDPADPDAVQSVLDTKQITPVAILSTHKHWDHSGGNEEWKRRYPRIKVYGGISESVPAATDFVSHGDQLSFGRLNITALLTPGHTSGHVVYVLQGIGCSSSLFSGDLLFIGGIGKMFEGTAKTMLTSLDTVCNLPGDTLLWPGHEYALSNLRFGAHLEPNNVQVKLKLKEVEDKRNSKLSTIPSSISSEKTYNPFLRTSDSSLIAALQIEFSSSNDDQDVRRAAVLKECRMRKDAFKFRG